MQAIFIRIEDTFEKAMYYRNGVQMQHYSFNGVQLLSGQQVPYIQKTACSEGVIIADFSVTAYTLCGTYLGGLTESFNIDETFQDENTGLWQCYWSLTNAPDYGEKLIYLRIETGANGVYYTSPFMLTSENSDSVHRFYYRNKETDTMQSVGLQMYYRQDSDITTLETYTTVSGNRQIQQNLDIVEFEIFQTKIVDYKVLMNFKRMCTSIYRYMDYFAFNLIEAPETKEFENNENFNQQIIKIQRNRNDVYDPFYVPPVPPPPPTTDYIILESVESVNSNTVKYTFSLVDITPTYLTYQWSLDEVNWNDSTSSPISPNNVGVSNNTTNNFYYRIYSPQFDAYSNVLQIALPSITLNEVYSADTAFNPLGNKYFYDFTLNNFTPNTQLNFETSVNGINWDSGSFTIYQNGNNSPKAVNTSSSNQERKYFRIRYISSDFTLQLTSNTVFFEL